MTPPGSKGENMMDEESRILCAADTVHARLGDAKIGVILGSGLGRFHEALEQAVSLNSEEIPGYPRSTVPGHAGIWWKGRLSGKETYLIQGRVHAYEGFSMKDVTLSVRMFRELGVRIVILTNAAGCCNASWEAGELMALSDHINLSGCNPLLGPNLERFGPRFPDMTNAYSPRLKQLAMEAARKRQLLLREGVYAWFLGPTYETPAEVRMAQKLGADAVGMSTVPETIVARHCGMEVMAFSCLTNMAAGLEGARLDHEEVLIRANQAGEHLKLLLRDVIGQLDV